MRENQGFWGDLKQKGDGPFKDVTGKKHRPSETIGQAGGRKNPLLRVQ